MARGLASTTVRWDGLQDLYKQLRNLPDDLVMQAANIVAFHAESAATDIEAAYPYGPAGRFRKGDPIEPGNLKAGMGAVGLSGGRWGINYLVINRAKHAWIYEHGTRARHYYTVNGIRKLVGSMPARPTFIPRVITWRRRMVDALAAMLERQGLRVSRA